MSNAPNIYIKCWQIVNNFIRAIAQYINAVIINNKVLIYIIIVIIFVIVITTVIKFWLCVFSVDSAIKQFYNIITQNSVKSFCKCSLIYIAGFDFLWCNFNTIKVFVFVYVVLHFWIPPKFLFTTIISCSLLYDKSSFVVCQ